ncbi:ESPR domain-containing protein, partial [Burkholderia mallei]
MNRSYRSIWNEALGAWVAASEISSARGKPNKSAVAKVVTAAVLAVVVQAAHASTIGVGTGSLPGGSADLPPTNRASRSLVKFVFG